MGGGGGGGGGGGDALSLTAEFCHKNMFQVVFSN